MTRHQDLDLDLDHFEHSMVEYQRGMASGFVTKLFDLCGVADEHNLAKLELAFPDYVRAHRAWVYGDLHERSKELFRR